ncbi:sodium:proline symporter [Burkholderia dolosa]|uniref:sodium:proline symporter n=1 Tax=Burkholderia dolosa TaxID=152500 RepID=UPI0027D30731|nr:sodium:proline symporter [Burkholderia dolosa]
MHRSAARRLPLLSAAFGAAIASSVVELPLWSLAGDDAMQNLYRDARLTAAIVMGRRVLDSAGGFDPLIMGVATLVHALLSVAYAALLTTMTRGRSFAPALLAGAAFGVVLYGVNLYAFTSIFPWFVPVRGAVTLIAHLVFGITAAAVHHIAERRVRR